MSPGFLLWQLSNSWQRKQLEVLKPLELTHVQFALLSGLEHLEGKEEAVTQRSLADYAKADPMMTSQVVRSLEKKGLLIRSEHASDARALRLTTTPKGREIVKKAQKVVDEVDKCFFSPSLIEELKSLKMD